MLDFPKWKYALVLLVILSGALYALPNIYPQDPAVQVSANRGRVIDAALVDKSRKALETAGIAFKSVEMADSRLLVRVSDYESQSKARDLIDEQFGDGYNVALNDASTVPAWLTAIGAKAMKLGLDLRGGVHFLMEVDQEAARVKREEAFLEDIRKLLQAGEVRYQGVSRTPEGVRIDLRSEADRSRSFDLIVDELPELEIRDGASAGDSWSMLANIRAQTLKEIQDKAVEQNIATLRNRIDELGTAEPVIQRQGSSRIVVQLPGVQDTALAKKILGSTATLEYRAVIGTDMDAFEAESSGRIPPDAVLLKRRDGRPVLLSKTIIASGDQLVDAGSGRSVDDNTPEVNVTLNAAGGKRMQDFTNENVGNGMAVVFIERVPETRLVEGKEVLGFKEKREVISVANINSPFGKRFRTTGLDSPEEAAELATLLRAGALAAPMQIVEERTVGPSLGRDNIEAGVKSVTIAFIATLLVMLIYYKVAGIIANIALLVNLVLILAALSIFGATLTMPGIAGIVLTVGMAVDANVLVFERIREELRNGNTPVSSIRAGYDKAWSTIADANITTLLAGIALFAFGTGPVRGFAVVLCVGILTSMFTAVTVSEAITTLIYGRGRKVKSVSV